MGAVHLHKSVGCIFGWTLLKNTSAHKQEVYLESNSRLLGKLKEKFSHAR